MGFLIVFFIAISPLTHENSENYDYFDYTVKIKLADLQHNSDTTRLDAVEENMKKRLLKYDKAVKMLS